MRSFYASLLFCAVFGMLAQAEGGNSRSTSEAAVVFADSGEVQIRLQYRSGRVQVRGVFKNEDLSVDSLAYEMEVRKTGPAGTSVTRQSGAFESRPGDVDRLSRSTISVASGDRLTIQLFVRDDQKLVAERTIDRTIP